jgi:uncharacterized protein (TIGR02145 family)
MAIWTNEINDLDALYKSFKGHMPDIVKEMEQLIRTDDPNVIMLYSRRCLEVIITDLCECELKRPRKTEPLKGIIDKLNSEEKVPSHIITSMLGLNSMANYGAHPKDFDPEQVKPVLNNLAIIIKWYLKYKDFQIVSKTKPEEENNESKVLDKSSEIVAKPKERSMHLIVKTLLGIVVIIVMAFLCIIIVKHYRQKKIEAYIADYNFRQINSEVKIGNQVWMTGNLDVNYFNDGSPIALVTDESEWSNLETPAYSWYNNNERKYMMSSYGALYNWYAVNTGKLCPGGWHVPTEAEWRTLLENVGGEDKAGYELKETGNTHWRKPQVITPAYEVTNHSGFTAVGGGNRNMYGPFEDLRKNSSWWSASENNDIGAMCVNLFSDAGNSLINPLNKKFGLSVRCIWDLPLITDYDNNSYKTVKIGNQIWMAENLKTTRYNDGAPIPMMTADTLLWNYETSTPSYSWCGNDKAVYYETYGKLYNWYAVNTGKLCPTGWHVPTDAEWTTLTDFLGGDSVAGGKLKETGTTHWISPNSYATDESGFKALPGGYNYGSIGQGEDGTNFHYGAYFWSSTSEDADADEDHLSVIAWRREMYTYQNSVERYVEGKVAGLSVRCVKD